MTVVIYETTEMIHFINFKIVKKWENGREITKSLILLLFSISEEYPKSI